MPEPRPLVFADLDDTLFQTRRKMNGSETYRRAAVAANGDARKSSFMTAQQSTLFNWLNSTTELVPVTARSGDAFSRVDLPFQSWAIISNGAVILEPGGTRHKPWSDKMHPLLASLEADMQEILDVGRAMADKANIDVRSWLVQEDVMTTYVVFKLNDIDGESIEKLRNLYIPLPLENWTRHFNSETLALIPPGSGKTAATRYLHDHLNGDNSRPTLGFGDSLSDLHYMQTTDILMIPARSQIAGTL